MTDLERGWAEVSSTTVAHEAELEKAQAELTRLRDHHDDLENELATAQAENARLREEEAVSRGVRLLQESEIARLREALERIAEMRGKDGLLTVQSNVARNALKETP